jgi:hypothetical protein
MLVGHATSEPVIAWWLDVKGVGESLRERYKVAKELPPKLLKVVRELDAIEGNQLLGSSGMPPDYEQMLEARIRRRRAAPKTLEHSPAEMKGPMSRWRARIVRTKPGVWHCGV